VTADRLDPEATEARLNLASGQAARDLRAWADEHRAEGEDVLAFRCDDLADRLDRIYPPGGVP
jgi:hypothetical protein